MHGKSTTHYRLRFGDEARISHLADVRVLLCVILIAMMSCCRVEAANSSQTATPTVTSSDLTDGTHKKSSTHTPTFIKTISNTLPIAKVPQAGLVTPATATLQSHLFSPVEGIPNSPAAKPVLLTFNFTNGARLDLWRARAAMVAMSPSASTRIVNNNGNGIISIDDIVEDPEKAANIKAAAFFLKHLDITSSVMSTSAPPAAGVESTRQGGDIVVTSPIVERHRHDPLSMFMVSDVTSDKLTLLLMGWFRESYVLYKKVEEAPSSPNGTAETSTAASVPTPTIPTEETLQFHFKEECFEQMVAPRQPPALRILITPPKPKVEPVSPLAQFVLELVAIVSSLLGSAAGRSGALLGSQYARNGALLAAAEQCPYDWAGELSIFTHPLRFSFGDDQHTKYYAGAMVGNVLVVVAFAVGHVLVTLAVRAFKQSSIEAVHKKQLAALNAATQQSLWINELDSQPRYDWTKDSVGEQKNELQTASSPTAPPPPPEFSFAAAATITSFPSLSLLPVLFLMQQSIMSCVIVLHHNGGSDEKTTMMAWLTLLVWLVVPFVVVYVTMIGPASALPAHFVDFPPPPAVVEGSSSSGLLFFFGAGEWVDMKQQNKQNVHEQKELSTTFVVVNSNEPQQRDETTTTHRCWPESFTTRFAMLFAPYRSPTKWFLTVELLTAIFLGIVSGLNPRDGTTCNDVNLGLAIIFGVYFLATCVWRPYITSFDLTMMVCISIAQLLSALFLRVNVGGEALAGQCAIVALCLVSIKGLADILLKVLHALGKVEALRDPEGELEKQRQERAPYVGGRFATQHEAPLLLNTPTASPLLDQINLLQHQITPSQQQQQPALSPSDRQELHLLRALELKCHGQPFTQELQLADHVKGGVRAHPPPPLGLGLLRSVGQELLVVPQRVTADELFNDDAHEDHVLLGGHSSEKQQQQRAERLRTLFDDDDRGNEALDGDNRRHRHTSREKRRERERRRQVKNRDRHAEFDAMMEIATTSSPRRHYSNSRRPHGERGHHGRQRN